jgi:carbamate kinase
MHRMVVALGGNAILQPKQAGTIEDQIENVRRTCVELAELISAGHEVIVTHGNGPQVGNILLQNEEAYRAAGIPAMPLDVCGSQTQGFIGYMMQRTLGNELRKRGISKNVVSVVTQVLVDRDDPAFLHPTKFIGPFYTESRAQRLTESRGYVMREDAGRGWRRVVPSPDPKAIVEKDAIKAIVGSGAVVIASGGGGVPVIREPDGSLTGVEAVIDKDLAGERLAVDVDADLFIILTDAGGIALDFGKPTQRFLDRMTLSEIREMQARNCFAPGNMGPKVEALTRFLVHGGRESVIAALEDAAMTLNGAGTHITA